MSIDGTPPFLSASDPAGDRAGPAPAQRIAGLVWIAALLGPVAVAAALIPLRSVTDPTNVALALVVVVVAVAAFGRRLPGIVAALVAGLAYDYFWAPPYYRLTIADPYEIQTAVLLVVVGAAVSELAWIGHRAARRAARSRGYLAGAVEIVSTSQLGDDPRDSITLVERRIEDILGADNCHYRPESAPADSSDATMTADGSILLGGRPYDADRHGLPTDRPTNIPIRAGGDDRGRLEVVAATSWSRPSREQRQVAVLLAGQLGEVLSRRRVLR
jgi:K+-sensing histidine kinase KdpD